MAPALTRETMLARMLAPGRAFDGQFITGVVSTGIYCLPSCRAKKPRPENVVFHATPAGARAAGLRPCKRCRPDDFYGGRDAGEALVEGLADRVRLDPGAFRNVGDLAGAAGAGVGTLHDLFRTHVHTTPAEFLAGSRVRAARRALLTGERPITEIAFGVGFGSLSAFNGNFRRYAATTPHALRGWCRASALDLALPPDYPVAATLRYLGRDRASPTERVEGRHYVTALRVGEHVVGVRVELSAGLARCTLTSTHPLGAEDRLLLHDRLLGLLGLHLDPRRFEAQVSRDPDLVPLVGGRRGLRPLLIADVFDALVWVILGQNTTFAHACTLRRRLVERWGEPVTGGLFLPPAPATLAPLEVADLLPLGLPRRGAEYLVGAARLVADGRLPLEALRGRSASRVGRTLLAVRGLGPWSVGYLLMRAFGFADAVPLGDSGLGEGLRRFFGLESRPSPADTARLMNRFAPHRSLATFHLWHGLDRGAARGQPSKEPG